MPETLPFTAFSSSLDVGSTKIGITKELGVACPRVSLRALRVKSIRAAAAELLLVAVGTAKQTDAAAVKALVDELILNDAQRIRRGKVAFAGLHKVRTALLGGKEVAGVLR